MGESMKSLYRRGAISGKQMRKMGGHREPDRDDRGGRSDHDADNRGKRTTAQPSKMADFNSKKRDEGSVRGNSAGRALGGFNEINHKPNQKVGSASMNLGLPSKGARVNKGGQPHVDAINENQSPKFPAGATVKKNSRPVGRQGLGGTSPGLRSSGPEYGGPSSRKYG